MNLEKDFGKKMKEACMKASKAMEELRIAFDQLHMKGKVHKSKYHY